MTAVKHVCVLTSGGDAPGMNAAIRAVVRTAMARSLRVSGARRGFTGLTEGDFVELNAAAVSNIIQRGGTILKTSRCDAFLTEEGRSKAADYLSAMGIDAVIGIGGDGTFRGLIDLEREHGVKAIGIPGTIDNDISGTDDTLGFDTAVNTALESIDKIRDTADSHDRMFFIEVMGRECGAIALEVGLAGGAEEIAVPEVPVDLDRVARTLAEGKRRGKTSFIAVVAEGAYPGGARAYAATLSDLIGLDYRVSVIGHVQRGGSPTSFDRIMGSLMGSAAVDAVAAGETGKMTAFVCNTIELVALDEVTRGKKALDLALLDVARRVAG
jgi:6-phosphofructokinase 1